MARINKTGLPKSQRRTQKSKRKTTRGDVGFPSIFLKPTGPLDPFVVDPLKRKKRKRFKI
jgi:hypothetical protein